MTAAAPSASNPPGGIRRASGRVAAALRAIEDGHVAGEAVEGLPPLALRRLGWALRRAPFLLAEVQLPELPPAVDQKLDHRTEDGPLEERYTLADSRIVELRRPPELPSHPVVRHKRESSATAEHVRR